MQPLTIQELFFQSIKAYLPNNISMVEEIADVLCISTDSAYRRIRGEKQITFEEIKTLAIHFNISIDHLLNRNTSNFIFKDNTIGKDKYDFNDQLEFHLTGLQGLKSLPDVEVIFFSRDIPIYYFYQFPQLLAFKYFYWMQSVFDNPDFGKKKFAIEDYQGAMAEKGKMAAILYTELASTEIWALEHINLTLQQIQFYKETNTFKKQEEINIIYDSVEALVGHVEEQAELGKKFMYNEPMKATDGSFQLYVNEFMIGGNNMLVKAGNTLRAYVNHSILNYLSTDDPLFCEYVMSRIQNVIKKSDLISRVGEKQRRSFFNHIRERIAYSRNR